MANTRSAEKQQRQAEKANARNRAGKSRLRSALKKARAAVDSGTADASVLSTGFSEIDKAAKTRHDQGQHRRPLQIAARGGLEARSAK